MKKLILVAGNLGLLIVFGLVGASIWTSRDSLSFHLSSTGLLFAFYLVAVAIFTGFVVSELDD